MTAPLNQSAGDEWLSDISAGAGVVSGLEKGGVGGTLQAGLSAARLGANTGLLNVSPGVGNALGEIGNVSGIVSGVQQGGVLGYGSAALNAGQLAERLGAISTTSTAGEAIPILGAALGIYSFAENWQSGKTGSDAVSGAEAGAAVGTAVVPGVGTLIGAGIGAVVGAASSWFGNGATDPEQGEWGNYLAAFQGGANANGGKGGAAAGASAVQGAPPQATFQVLAGLFDMRSSNLPFYNQFGRMQEGAFTTAMATQINSALAKGTISPSSTPTQIFNSVVSPWIAAMPGGSADWASKALGQDAGPAIQTLLTSMIGQYQAGQLTATTHVGIGGQQITGLPAYGAAGLAPAATKAKQTVAQNVAPLHEAVASMPTGAAATTAADGATLPSSSASSAMLPLMLAMPALFAGANAMADPNNPGATSGSTGAPTSGNTTLAPDNSGNSGALSDLSSFLSSPAGSLAEYGTLAGLGIAQASSQENTNNELAGSLSTAGAPFTAAGQAELGQLEGGPAVGGPLGASITQQTGAAAELGNVANEYSTGNLTPAQQAQVQDYINQQRAQVDTQLAASGTPAGSSQDAAYQQIDDNAAQLTQQLTNQNIQTGAAALTAVQSTYTGLLNQALSSSEFGFSTDLAAVQTQIQSDTALAASLNTLFAGIAQGYGNAVGGGGNKAGGTGVAGLGAAAGVAASAAGGGSSDAGPTSGNAATGAFDQTTASDIGVSPVDVNANPFYQSIEQGQEDALANSIDSANSPTGSLDTFAENTAGQDVLSDFGGDPFSG